MSFSQLDDPKDAHRLFEIGRILNVRCDLRSPEVSCNRNAATFPIFNITFCQYKIWYGTSCRRSGTRPSFPVPLSSCDMTVVERGEKYTREPAIFHVTVTSFPRNDAKYRLIFRERIVDTLRQISYIFLFINVI